MMKHDKQAHEKIELVLPDEEKWVKKLIYLKRNEDSTRWHFAMPELTERDGMLTFCEQRIWPQVHVQSQKKFFDDKNTKGTVVCGRCAEEYAIAEDALRANDYI